MTKRVAVLSTTYEYRSHGQQIADRLLVGYPCEGQWRRPEVQVAAVYVEQKPQDDVSGQRAAEFGFRVYPTVAETLRCGGERLAVDGLIMAGAFSKPCLEIFQAERRAVPVYQDMRRCSFEEARHMVESARRLHFPLLAGSALPLTWRLPDLELPRGCEIEEALMVGAGESESVPYDALEAMQAMIERRRNGESGVRTVQAIEGDAVWKAGDEGRWSKQLLAAALSRSDTPQGLTLQDGRTQDLVGSGQLPKLVAKPVAYFVEHRDGLRTTLLILTGAVKDFTFAARLKGGETASTQFFLSPEPDETYTAWLAHKIVEMFGTGKAPYPAERALLVRGVLESGANSLSQGSRRLETPDLNIAYEPPASSQHCRG